MATKCVVNKSTLTDIATAIRTKGGTTDTLLPSEMPAAIAAIPSGGGSGLFSVPSPYAFMIPAIKDYLDNLDYTQVGWLRERAVAMVYLGATSVTFSNYNYYNVFVNGVATGVAARQSVALGEGINIVVWNPNQNPIDTALSSPILVFADGAQNLTVSTVANNVKPSIVYMPNGIVTLNFGYQRTAYSTIVCKGINFAGSDFSNGCSLVVGESGVISTTRENVAAQRWLVYPKAINCRASINLSAMAYPDKQSFAVFEDGELVDGMVKHFIDLTGETGYTITLGSTIKAKFTDDEIAKIEAEINSKNWTVAW